MTTLINNIAVDCVIFGFHNGKLKILLTKRELKDPDSGTPIFTDYTLQGHHVLQGENVNDAARRVLKEKTGLSNIYLKQFYTFGDADRVDTEKDRLWSKIKYPTVARQVISVGYYSLVDSSKVIPNSEYHETKWFSVNKLPDMGFDHEKIIMMALCYLRNEIRREPIGFELLPDKFTLSQFQTLYETILGVQLDKRNFRKKVAQMKYVIRLDEKLKGVGHKPAQVYIFSREVFEKTKKGRFDFYI